MALEIIKHSFWINNFVFLIFDTQERQGLFKLPFDPYEIGLLSFPDLDSNSESFSDARLTESNHNARLPEYESHLDLEFNIDLSFYPISQEIPSISIADHSQGTDSTCCS